MTGEAIGPVLVRLLMADRTVVEFKYDVPPGQMLQALELSAGSPPSAVVRVPLYLHGKSLHTVCHLLAPDFHSGKTCMDDPLTGVPDSIVIRQVEW